MVLDDNPFSVSNVYDFSLFQFDIESSVSASYKLFSRSIYQQCMFMALHDNPYSVSNGCDFSLSAMYGHDLHSSDSATESPKRISDLFLPPGFPSSVDLFNFMTNEDDVVSFEYMIAESERAELQKLMSLLTSDSDYFLTIVGNKFGSERMLKLLGNSDDIDALFCEAIRDRFLQIMTDKYASQVALRATAVFDKKQKTTMYEHVLFHALDIACDKDGCIALKDIITDLDDEYYRDGILEFVALNALILSKHESGNYVVQHVLELNNLPYTYKIAYNLSGHCVELSFNKYGSFVVEKLLEADGKSMVVFVAMELLKCNEDRLIRLARNEFGNYVVRKTFRIAREMYYNNLFVNLVLKLRPFIHLLRTSHSRHIANILDSEFMS